MVTWRRLLTWAAGAALVQYALVMILAGEVIPPLVVIAVVLAAGLVLMRRPGRTGVVVALVGLVLFFAVNSAFAFRAIAEPASFPSFALVLTAQLTGIVGASAGFEALRGDAPSRWPRVYALCLAAAAAVLVAVNLAVSVAYDDPARGPGDVALVAKGTRWIPSTLSASAGRVTFFVANRDRQLHNFHVKGQGALSVPAAHAATQTLTLPAGTYAYVCDLHADQMTGTLTVT
jgi:plastocyanin